MRQVAHCTVKAVRVAEGRREGEGEGVRWREEGKERGWERGREPWGKGEASVKGVEGEGEVKAEGEGER